MGKASDFFGSGGGDGAGYVLLAPELDFPTVANTRGLNRRSVSGVDISSGLTPVLSLTGKWVIFGLYLESLHTSGPVDIKMTVDDQVIWNSTSPVPANYGEVNLFGSLSTSDFNAEGGFACNESLVLEVYQAGQTSAGATFLARPIL